MKPRTYTLPVKYNVINRRAYARWGITRAKIIIVNMIYVENRDLWG